MNMARITHIDAEEIQDSRGNPTLRVTVHAEAARGTFSVPSGASTGSHEAKELRDADGGMDRAIAGIKDMLAPALIGLNVDDQRTIDGRLLMQDGTTQKTRFGGNALLGISAACARAAAASQGLELYEYLRTLADITRSQAAPYLYMNYINGGKHAKSRVTFQEHMIVPLTENISEALDMARTFENALGGILFSTYGKDVAESMGDEGGFVLDESEPEKPFVLMDEALREAQLTGKVAFAIDAAATSFYRNGTYDVGGNSLSSDELFSLYEELARKHALISIEDPFHEEDFDTFARLRGKHMTRIVGDDLTVTNMSRLDMAIERESIDAVIIKPNQVGTLTETLDTMKRAREKNIDCIVSHRSGETDDDFIADLAFAFGCFGLKAGSLRKPERVLKYRRLQAISNG